MIVKKRFILYIALCSILLIAAVIVVLVFFVFKDTDTPADLFKNIERSDIESITASHMDGTHAELKGESIDEFIRIMRETEYERSDREEHYASGPIFTIRLKSGEEHTITTVGPYEADRNYKGFIIMNGACFECYTTELRDLFYANSDAKYADWFLNKED